MITLGQYLKVVKFRYSVSHFECTLDGCNHIFNSEGSNLPTPAVVVGHLLAEHEWGRGLVLDASWEKK